MTRIVVIMLFVLSVIAIGLLSSLLPGCSACVESVTCESRCKMIRGIKEAEGFYDCYCRLPNGYLVWYDNYGHHPPVIIEVER